MSKNCADDSTNTKQQRSIFQRFLHSRLIRSCWSVSQPTLEEPTASTSLLSGPGANYQSSNATQTTTTPRTPRDNRTANNDNTILIEDTSRFQSAAPITPQELENVEIQQSAAPVDELAIDSYSTSSFDDIPDDQQNLTTIESSISRIGPGSSLTDYLIADSQHQTHDDEGRDEFETAEEAEQLMTEWDRYTTMPEDPVPQKEPGKLYDDLIAHSLDDYNEKAEIEMEMKNRKGPVEYGPVTREEFIRLAFCRVKRHNACSKLKNDTPTNYYFKAQVGEGSYSTVYEAYRAENKQQYAIKVANKLQIAKERKVQYVTREKDIMATLTYGHGGHPFICGIFCSFQEVDKLYYVLPYAANSELAMWLRRLGSFDVHVSQFYASEILAALEYIHGCGIIHRDLKPENVLIRNDWHIMLSDFGSCKVIGYEGDRKMRNPRKQVKQRSTFVGTAQYISPEVASGKSCGPEADFWALGCIIFHMISGQSPFRGINEYQILQKVHKLLYRFPAGFDEEAKELVKLLLVAEVETRLGHNGIEEIKSHPFFKEVEWETITTRKPPEIRPYIPSTDEEPAFYSDINFTETETGLSNSTLARLMGFSQATTNLPSNQQTNDRTQLSESARKAKLETQKRTNPYHDFVGDDVLIIKYGFVDKKRGLFARRRMFLLTENGRFLYIDTVRNIMKGEVPLSKEVRTEAKNFKTFFVHTPSRTYFLFDPERRAMEWCNAIENVRNSVFGKPTEEDLAKKPGNNAKLTKNLSRQFKPSNSN